MKEKTLEFPKSLNLKEFMVSSSWLEKRKMTECLKQLHFRRRILSTKNLIKMRVESHF